MVGNSGLKHRGTKSTEFRDRGLCVLCGSVFPSSSCIRHQLPIGVSEYQITKHLPDELKLSLPTIEQIEAELGEVGDE